jgi:CASP C terminal
VRSACRGTGRRSASLSAAEAGQSAEDRYSREYEKKLDPFSEFRGRVRDSSRAQMPVADKIVYLVGQLVFGSRAARLAVVLYFALMHFFTFSVLATVSHSRYGAAVTAHDHVGCVNAVATAGLTANTLAAEPPPGGLPG